ncbi:hypothetical protein CANMA_004682 [Candida margitis]|uniref:uncharacterized protein n=1 Tax=Candida margitis TaxID=1775924 RepID=UPI002226F364|nr:uncharacterized protein CANMA_004682 [Candida margitis]KAI5953844.1 hypothetical protein CANMA_004682 [Candida margitis]
MHRICQLVPKISTLTTNHLVNASFKQQVRHCASYSTQRHHSSISDKFRLTMSRLASPAMVLTSAIPMIKSTSTSPSTSTAPPVTDDKSHIDPKQDLHGMTLSSVCSLSVHPNPYLEFNLHLPSYTSTAIHNHQYLAIHLMPPTRHSAKICRVFAKGVKLNKRGTKWTSKPITKAQQSVDNDVKNNKNNDEDDDGEIFHEMTTPFTNLVEDQDYTFIKKHDENIAIPILSHAESIFICKTTHNFTIDDHEIWVAKVIDVITDPHLHKSGGLLYFNKGFHKIGETLSEE